MPLRSLRSRGRCCEAERTLLRLSLRRWSSSLSSAAPPNQSPNSAALTADEEATAAEMKSLLLRARKGSVEDLVRALAVECSEVQLMNGVADSLLRRCEDDWKSALGFFLWAQSRGGGYSHTPYACNRMVDLLGKMRQKPAEDESYCA